ncbi:MAG: type II secretion system protein [Pedosphaera sp.]|nr:type II secretion system protein [Pedosphaera sp.]
MKPGRRRPSSGGSDTNVGCPGAFTLVELLVAIGVITVLAALLLSAIGQARRLAVAAHCTSNLRQLGLGTQMYWDEHGGRCFRYGGQVTNGGADYWFGWLGNGAEGGRAFDSRSGAIFPYTRDGVLRCPGLRDGVAGFKPKAKRSICSYGYNLNLSPPAGQPAVQGSSVMSGTQTALFADAAQVNTFQFPASPEHPLLEEFYYVSTREQTVHFRHRSRAQVVFMDGRVGREEAEMSFLDLRVPGQRVGRLPTAILGELPRWSWAP